MSHLRFLVEDPLFLFLVGIIITDWLTSSIEVVFRIEFWGELEPDTGGMIEKAVWFSPAPVASVDLLMSVWFIRFRLVFLLDFGSC